MKGCTRNLFRSALRATSFTTISKMSLVKEYNQVDIFNKTKLGDIVNVCLTSDRLHFSRNNSPDTIPAHIIGYENDKYFYSGFPKKGVFVLGFKSKVADSYSRHHVSEFSEISKDFYDYAFQYVWYNNDVFIKNIECSIDGNWCASCSTYFKYSSSNQKDGSFICWSCRNFPHYKHRVQ